MIRIFNGQWMGLGDGGPSLFMQLGFEFRDHIHHFKGARLPVFMAIALHADSNGLAWPGYETMMKETGLKREAIAKALADLCSLEVNGSRVLMRWRQRDKHGRFAGSNRYRIFPTKEQIAEQEPEFEKRTLGLPNVGKTELEEEPLIKPEPFNKQEPSIRDRRATRRTPKARDERTDHPAIQMIREVTGRLPAKAAYDFIIAKIGDQPDSVEFKRVQEAWVLKGYSPTNIGGMLDWYTNGIPLNGNGKSHNGNGNSLQASLDVLAEMRRKADNGEL